MSDQDIEREIQAKGLNHPRVRPESIDRLMRLVRYHTHFVPGTTTTVVTAIAGNGFTLATEISACASPANFDPEIGRKAALERCEKAARDKLWELEGWHLKRNLHRAVKADDSRKPSRDPLLNRVLTAWRRRFPGGPGGDGSSPAR